MSGAGIICNCGCGDGTNCVWCAGTCNTATANGPVKLDCRGNCAVSLNFGLTASYDHGADPVTCVDTTVIPDPDDAPTDASFVPKERILLPDGGDTCLWQYGYSNLDGEFYRDRVCFDDEGSVLSAELIEANRDRWLYSQSVEVSINPITEGDTLGLDPPEGVDLDDPDDQANWRLIIGVGLIRGQYTHRDSITNLDCVRYFPSPQGDDGIYFFGYKYVQVSEICAGNTITFDDTGTDPPDVAPYNTYVPMEGREGTMSVLFNPDVPDNAHLATDLSPAYLITFYVCKKVDDVDVSYTRTITVYQNSYPDSRRWEGVDGDDTASLDLQRAGNSVAIAEYAPGDGDETIFVIAADIAGEGFDNILIDAGSEFIVPLDRRVEIYTDEGEGFTVQVEVSASGSASPNDPPCPE